MKFASFYFSLLSLSVASCPAFASEGGSGGNGGQSVVCQRGNGAEFTAEAFDTFEGAYLFGYRYFSGRFVKPVPFALELAAALDEHVRSPIPLAERVRRVADAVAASRGYPALRLTDDIAPLYLPAGCGLAQTLVFQKDGTILVNKLAWNRLDGLGQAALYLHEAIYWHLRETNGDTDSQRTRRIVSYLLKGGNLRDAPNALDTYDPTPVYCTSLGGIRRGHTNGMFLATEPDGRLALLKIGGFNGQLLRVSMRGRLPGAALVSGGEFRPSAEGVFEGEISDDDELAVKLSIAAAGSARLTLSNISGARKDISLGCRPYRHLLP